MILMDKTLLKQALKFKDKSPTHSQTTHFNALVKTYQQENNITFMHLKRGQKSKILDNKEFFLFLCEKGNVGRKIASFDDMEQLLAHTTTRQENIENTGESKSRYIKVFDKVVIYQDGNTQPKIYKNTSKSP